MAPISSITGIGDSTIAWRGRPAITSVVTRSVPDFHLVMGNPAKSVGGVCRCGQLVTRFTPEQAQVDREQSCSRCGMRYRVTGLTIIELDPPDEPTMRSADESIH